MSLYTSKFWEVDRKQLTVSFFGRQSPEFRDRVIRYMNEWSRSRDRIRFVPSEDSGNVRISTDPFGSWSFVGTDILLIPPDQPTTNLGGLTDDSSADEFRRTVQHQAGHLLGFPHTSLTRQQFSLIDGKKMYEYFGRVLGWDQKTVERQICNTIIPGADGVAVKGNDSVMGWQIPSFLMKNGVALSGANSITERDTAYFANLFPSST